MSSNSSTSRGPQPQPVEAATQTAPITPYLNLETVSKLIDVPVRTLYKWRLHGSFPRAVKTPGGRLLVRADWLEEWLDNFESDILPGA